MSGTYEYTGEAVIPPESAVKVTYTDHGKTVEIPSSEYTIDFSDKINVGTHTLHITDKAGGNYTVSGTGSFTISPASLSSASVQVTGEYIYTGTAHQPTAGNVTVTLGNAALTEGTDYSLSYGENINAGTSAGTVTVTGQGNYSGAAAGNFEIKPAPLKAEGAGHARGTYGTPLSGLTVMSLTAQREDNGTTVPGTWKLTGDTIPNVGDTGSYTAAFTPASGADNYEPLTAQVRLGISKPAQTPAPKTGTLAVQNKQAKAYTFNLSQLLPDLGAGLTLGTVSYELGAVSLGDYYDNAEPAAIAESTLTLPIQNVESEAEGAIGTVTITIKSQNYADIAATINVESSNKTSVTVSGVSVDGRTYNGKALAYSGTPTATDGGGNQVQVKGFTYKWDTPDGSAPIHAGRYHLTVSVAEDDPNFTGSQAIDVEITKAAVTITAPA